MKQYGNCLMENCFRFRFFEVGWSLGKASVKEALLGWQGFC